MHAVEFLIDRFKEQIALAENPATALQENDVAGGSIEWLTSRLKEGMNHAKHIDILKGVESGPRRYGKYFAAALVSVEKLKEVFAKINATAGAAYLDGEQRERAMGKFKGTSKVIIDLCKEALGHLEHALAVVHEGEARDAKQAVLAK